MPSSRFASDVAQIVRMIPCGQLATYGQIATLLGVPRAARAVGWTAHWGDPDVPWQRVVNRNGRVAPGWPGGMTAHAAVLAKEGIVLNADFCADLHKHRWVPSQEQLEALGLESLDSDLFPYASG